MAEFPDRDSAKANRSPIIRPQKVVRKTVESRSKSNERKESAQSFLRGLWKQLDKG